MPPSNPFTESEPTAAVGGALPLRHERATLALVHGASAHRVERACTVGSAPGADLTIAATGVSRLHARLEPADAGVWINDLESTNGTFVDDVRVRAALLVDGSRVRLGTAELRVVAEGAPTEVPLWPNDRFGALLGRSEPMRELFEVLARVSASDATVLVQGETGTGKELVARAIHETSPRARGPFVIFDCGAVPEALFESELFGHVRGAFTGADRARDGAAPSADHGTLFLDEVGELPLSVQPKLLRMLESKTVRRVGETQHRPVDLRVVAATHRDLARLVAEGAFREDLYFRLAVIPVAIPPLRARRDDVDLLLAHFLGGAAVLTAAHYALARERPLTGNVRELRSLAERIRALGADAALRLDGPAGPSTLVPPPAPVAGDASSPAVDLDAPLQAQRDAWLDRLEAAYLRGWLDRTGHNVSAIAERTGLNRTYLHRLLRKHDLGR